jgi:hypothetical protein
LSQFPNISNLRLLIQRFSLAQCRLVFFQHHIFVKAVCGDSALIFFVIPADIFFIEILLDQFGNYFLVHDKIYKRNVFLGDNTFCNLVRGPTAFIADYFGYLESAVSSVAVPE